MNFPTLQCTGYDKPLTKAERPSKISSYEAKNIGRVLGYGKVCEPEEVIALIQKDVCALTVRRTLNKVGIKAKDKKRSLFYQIRR